MPTMSRFFMSARVPANLMLVVFGPFAAGYFLSFFFRNVNAVISKDLAGEFSLSPSDLGFLTSMYLLAFAAFQLPLGVLLDRYGPRRVVAVLLCVAAAGALIFALARDFTMLFAASVGAALLVFFFVPEKKLPGAGQSLRQQVAGFGSIFASLPFWRIALPLTVCHAGYLTLQGLWLRPWLYDVPGGTRQGVANYL